jgi:ADP-L-glycero-D-manno-heptose 6-epimerase
MGGTIMIIVTGAAGFIGSNIVKEFNRRGRTDILVVDDLKDGENYKNLRGLQFIDYQHKDDFLKSIEDDDFDGTDIDAVFHEGACSDTMEYDVNFMMRVNYEYSKALLHFTASRSSTPPPPRPTAAVCTASARAMPARMR